MGTTTLSPTFGAVLRELRERAGLSQEALAERAGLHRTYVGLLERGKRNPTLDVAHQLGAALGVTLTALVAEVERRAQEHPSL
jgi:transcriptional regulator with XRE-family HTH domain